MAAYDFAAARLYVEAALSPGAEIDIRDDRANYLLNVLRLKDGEAIHLFNGIDGEWRARLVERKKRVARLRIEECARAQQGGPDIDYCFAPLKHARLDYLVQKAVEMGVARLRPVITRRTQVARVNLERMRANVVEAAEQCGVLRLPIVEPDAPFARMVAQWPADRALIFCDEEAPVADPVQALRALPRAAPLGLLIGPEGGFDPAERAALLGRANVLALSLGPRILRADTAGVAALALVQAVVGDWI